MMSAIMFVLSLIKAIQPLTIKGFESLLQLVQLFYLNLDMSQGGI